MDTLWDREKELEKNNNTLCTYLHHKINGVSNKYHTNANGWQSNHTKKQWTTEMFRIQSAQLTLCLHTSRNQLICWIHFKLFFSMIELPTCLQKFIVDSINEFDTLFPLNSYVSIYLIHCRYWCNILTLQWD